MFKPGQQSTAGRLKDMAERVTAKMEKPPASRDRARAPPIQKVEVVPQPSFQDRLRSATGPYLEFLGVGSFVLILVLFMLMGREDLSDRIVGLFGHRQVSLTTRTMEEIGQRISRYLATFALVNSGFGLVIGLGLGLIGVPYRGALGLPGGDAAVHPLRRAGGGVHPAAGLLLRALPGLGAAAGGRRPVRGGRGRCSTASWSRSSTARRRGSRPWACSSPPCSGPGSGGRSGCSSRPR